MSAYLARNYQTCAKKHQKCAGTTKRAPLFLRYFFVIDRCFFYERSIVRLRDVCPSATPWKISKKVLTKTKKTGICICSERIYITQNQHRQSAIYSLINNWRLLITKLANMCPSYIKWEGHMKWLFWFFEFIDRTHCKLYKYKQNSHPFGKKLNFNHVIRSSSPVKNSSGLLTNINIT